jgi:glycosyltransferase involved in cell wall biosynthesis
VRLLLVNYEYPPLGGGAANATMFMARALVGLGHEATVLSTAFEALRGHAVEQNVHVYRIEACRTAADRSNPREMLSFLWIGLANARGVARERGIEAVIAFFTIPSGPIAYWLDRSLGLPYVISLRGGDVPGLVPELGCVHRLIAPVRRAALRRARAIVANSPSLASLSEAADPFPVRVVPNGVDASFFSPRSTPKKAGPFRVLFVGRLTNQKNLPGLLEAVSTLAADGVDFTLDVVGDGPLRGQLEALSAQLALGDRVSWHGWLPKGDVLALYRRADCFVNPSIYEGMPNTVLEAMACGLPVIASRIGGNEDLVRDRETGRLFEVTQTVTLADALQDLIRDPDACRRMGARGRDVVTREHSWESVVAKYVGLLRPDEC